MPDTTEKLLIGTYIFSVVKIGDVNMFRIPKSLSVNEEGAREVPMSDEDMYCQRIDVSEYSSFAIIDGKTSYADSLCLLFRDGRIIDSARFTTPTACEYPEDARRMYGVHGFEKIPQYQDLVHLNCLVAEYFNENDTLLVICSAGPGVQACDEEPNGGSESE